MIRILALCLVASLSLSAQTTLPLVQQADLVYQGAFRVPFGGAFDYGGTALTYVPSRDSLMAVGGVPGQEYVGEFSLPTLKVSATVGGLDRAVMKQSVTDILVGKMSTIDGETGSGVKIGGLLPFGSGLVVSVFAYFDTKVPPQSLSHFKTGQDFAALGPVLGPIQVGNGEAGFVSGYMTPIPQAWQAALGGAHLTGNSNLAIISRTSIGPSVSAFNAADVGVLSPVPATRLLAYPVAHPTLGTYQSGEWTNGAVTITGVVFPDGTRSVLFFGRKGITTTDVCYGSGTSTLALHRQPVPGEPGAMYCYDPGDPYKGYHNYPYTFFVLAYDANDLAAVKSGTKQPWDVLPYAKWTFDTPFQLATERNSRRLVLGSAYKPATQQVILSMGAQDGTEPVFHAYKVAIGTAPPVPVDCVVSAWGDWSAWASGATEQTRTRTRTMITPAANGGAAGPALTETERQPLPPPPPATVKSATMIAKTWVLTVADDPPDATLGWRVQFYRDGVPHGTVDATGPAYTRSATVTTCTNNVTATWTKTGQPQVVRAPKTVVCQ